MSRHPEVELMSQKLSDKQVVVFPLEERSGKSCRALAQHHLELCLTMAGQTGRRIGVFCVQIDRQTDHPRESEDEIFERLKRRLPELLSSRDQVGWPWRGGLIVVQSTTADAFDMYRNARGLLADLERLLHRPGGSKPPKLSLGVALHPEDGSTPSALLDQAHAAAARAGDWDHNGLCFSSQSTGKEVADRLTTDVALCRALKAGTVEMRFQPVLDLQRSCMIGLRAEPAWRHPDRGEIVGEEILAAVERSNLAAAYNVWLVEEICRQSRQWAQGLHHQRCSFKVTRSQLADTSFATQLSLALDAHEVRADLIDVAIDGKLFIDETDHRLRTGLRQLADLGVRLTVADVGVELLSLEALKTLPLGTVELAPDLVTTIGRCSSSERALTALIGFTTALGLGTRAVDVDSDEQLRFLNNVRCDEAMGPLFAPLMRADDIDRMTSLRPCFEELMRQDPSAQKIIHMH